MKAGYQGKPDSMRDMANKLLSHPGSAPAVIPSKSAADKEKMRPFKTGGSVKSEKKESKVYEAMENKVRVGASRKDKKGCAKFAMGGVAKIRHDEATASGQPKTFKKKSLKDVL